MPAQIFQNGLELLAYNWLALAKGLVQLTILVGIIYFFYVRFIRKSHAEQLLKGLFITLLLFVGLWGIARVLSLQMLEVVFGASIQLLFIGLLVIFQPELRRMLLYLGQSEIFGWQGLITSSEEQKAEYLIQELAETVNFLSKSKRGALIVLESQNNPGGDYLEVGTTLDAKLSTELLLTIFHPNTPLHDGAVVISPENRISAAGVLLPLTEDPKLSWQYGTRHRAAIGLTEVSDSTCIVVSEESGGLSLVRDGKLEKMHGMDELKKALERMYHVTVKGGGGKKESRGGRFSDLVDTLPNSIQRLIHRRQDKKPGKPGDGKLPKSGTGG